MAEPDAPRHDETGRRWSVPIARIAGVTVRVHVTFLALVALVALTAGEADETVLEAVGWLILLFACVVVHELAHALVARTKGVDVHEIDLLPIGGVSRLEKMPETWQDESAIAVAGPLASIGLAGLAFLAAATAHLALLPPTIFDGPLLVRLAWVNLLLAAFNVLPAFPLDGGRVLRAQLERSRSRLDATRVAVRVSRVLAWTMIFAGLLLNFWLVVIGVFVIITGKAEEAAVLIHATLGPEPASLVAVACPVTIPDIAEAGAAEQYARQSFQPAFPVVRGDGRPIGLVTLEMLHRARPDVHVGQLVSTASIDADASLEDAVDLLRDGPVGVFRGDELIGVVTKHILATHLEQRMQEAEPQ